MKPDRELWPADLDARNVTRVTPGERDDEEVLGAAEVLRTDLLDGFAFELARVF